MSFTDFPLKSLVSRQIKYRTGRTKAFAVLSLLLITSISAQAQTQPTFQSTISSFYEYGVSMIFGAQQDDSPQIRRPKSAPTLDLEQKTGADDSKIAVDNPSLNAPALCARNGTVRTVGGAGSGAQFATIQDAINASQFTPGGDTIQVASGFNNVGQVVIDRCVFIEAAPGFTTRPTITAPATLANVNEPNAGNSAAIVEVSARTAASITNINVTGPVPVNTTTTTYGILIIQDARLVLTDSNVTNIQQSGGALVDANSGIGIRAGVTGASQTNASPGTLNATRVSVSGYNKAGIVIDRAPVDAASNSTIADSTVTGANATTVVVQNGIQISRGASATVTNSTISNNRFTGTTGEDSAGILLFEAGAVTIGTSSAPASGAAPVGGNTISNNNVGVFSDFSTTGGTGVPSTALTSVIGNTFTGNINFGADFDSVNANIGYNFFTGSNVGIAVSGATGATGSTVNIQRNSITAPSQAGTTGGSVGILFDDPEGGAVTSIGTFNVNFNRIFGHTVGIQNLFNNGISVFADNNFYGCNEGPTQGTRTTTAGCDTFQGVVDTQPFLVLSIGSSSNSVNSGGTATITADLTRNSAGQVVAAGGNSLPSRIPPTTTSANSPNGIPVTFTATNGVFLTGATSTASTLTIPLGTTAVSGTVADGVPGIATATFRSNTASGNQTATVSVQVDNAVQTITINVIDNVGPTTDVRLANGQPATTSNDPINFTVEFNEPVTGFTATDVVLTTTGTASVANATITVTPATGSGTVFNVAVTGASGSGNITLSVPANVAQDAQGNGNQASDSVPATVATVNFQSEAARNCAAIASPFNVFTEFNINNPNCQFSYGFTTPDVNENVNSFNLYTRRGFFSPLGGTGERIVYRSDADPGPVPAVFTDNANSRLVLHPGIDGSRSVVRFTVGPTTPAGGNVPAGFYKINGGFFDADPSAFATTDVRIILRRTSTGTTPTTTSTVLYESDIVSDNDEALFDVPILLQAGDVIDFSVGSNGSAANDSTGLQATILAFPLPTEVLYALVNPTAGSTAQQLVRFNSTDPNRLLPFTTQTASPDRVTITGLQAGERLVGIDFRPLTRALYGLAVNGTTGRLYVINVATQTGGTVQANAIGGTFAVDGTRFGFDFNPVPDRIRVISDNGLNIRLNPDTGAVTVDPRINPDSEQVSGAAYTNNFVGATTTTLFDIGETRNATTQDRLYRQGNPSPNDGRLTFIGGLDVDANLVNGFDISSVGSTSTNTVNTPYAALQVSTTATPSTDSDLYTVNLTDGSTSRIGRIGSVESSDNNTGTFQVEGLSATPIGGVSNATAPATLSISAASTPPAVSEGDTGTTTATFTVTLSAVQTFDVSATVTAGGTATPGTDFTLAPSGTTRVVIPAGQTTATITATIIGDNNIEPDETFTATLSDPSGATLGNATGTGTITNEDAIGAFRFSSATYSVNEGAGTFGVTVTRAPANDGAASVTVTVTGGTATAGTDFTAPTQTLNFAQGQTEATFNVTIINDAISENNETVNLALSAPTNGASLGTPATAQLTITDNDGGGSVTISGIITDAAGQPLNNVRVDLNGTQNGATVSQFTFTGTDGRYTFTVPSATTSGGTSSFTVTPSQSGFVFDPPSRTFTNLSTSVNDANFVRTADNGALRNIRVVNSIAAQGSNSVVVPIEITSQGNESDISFSLTYNSNLLTFAGVSTGPDAPAGSTVTFSNSASGGTGSIGIVFDAGTTSTGAQQTLTAGTRRFVNVTFTITGTPTATQQNTPINFSNTPTIISVSNPNGDPLQFSTTNGVVAFANQGIEGDVSPRNTATGQSGNGSVTIADVAQIRNFVAGIDQPQTTSNEFQRADVAPISTRGDGRFTAADVAVARQYAAQLIAPQAAGGPTTQLPPPTPGEMLEKALGGKVESTLAPNGTSVLRISTVNARQGVQQVTAVVDTIAVGDENAYGFSINYDPTRLSIPTGAVTLDPQAVSNAGSPATLTINNNNPGRLGILLDFPTNQTIVAGTRRLLTIRFTVISGTPAGAIPLTFGDSPVIRETVDVNANPQNTQYNGGSVNILAPTAAAVSAGGRVTTAAGRGIGHAYITMTDEAGEARTAITNAFGYYRFDNVPAGGTYVFSIVTKRNTFGDGTQARAINSETNDINFVANE